MSKQMKWLGAAALVASFSLVLTACGGGADDGNTDNGSDGGTASQEEGATTVEGADYNPVPREEMQQGGDVTRGITEITEQMNAMHSDGSVDTQTIWTWYNPQIILSTPEGESYPNPAYISDRTEEVVDGNTVLTLTFTEEAVFNDGTPMDWKTIENTWKANRDVTGDFKANSDEGYRNIKSVEAGDTDKTAVVTFDGTFAWTDALFFNVVHPKVNTPKLFNEGYIEEPHPEWGAGPYKIEKMDLSGGVATFVPNEKWWGDEPLLDSVTFRVMEPTAAMNAFRSGEIDIVGTGTADRLEQVADMEDVTTYRAATTATALLELNADRPQFADLETRKAVMMALNRDQITEVLWQGLDYSEEPPGSFNLYPFQEGYENSLKNAGYEFNVEEANAILDDAGWEMGDDGYRSRDGVEFAGEMPMFGDDPITEARSRVIQQQLKEIGFKMSIDQRAASEFSETLSSGDWDFVYLGFSSSDAYGVMWMCQLYCEGSGLNLSGTMDASFDERIHEVEAFPTAEEQIPAAMELEAELMAESWGIFPVENGPTIMTAKNGLANLTPEPYTGLDLFGVQPIENFGWAAE